jgi:hypothetical protein
MSIKPQRLVYAALGPAVIVESYNAIRELHKLPPLSDNKIHQLFTFLAVLRALKTWDRLSANKCVQLGVPITLADKCTRLNLVSSWVKFKKTYTLTANGKALVKDWSEALEECIVFYCADITHPNAIKTTSHPNKHNLAQLSKRIGSLSGFDRKY